MARVLLLASVAAGIVPAILVGAEVIPPLIDSHPARMRGFFLGLVLASVAVPLREIDRRGPSRWLLTLVAAIVTVWFVGLPEPSGGHARGLVTLELDAPPAAAVTLTPNDLTLRAPDDGTRPDIEYRLRTSLTVPAGTTLVEAQILAKMAGDAGNLPARRDPGGRRAARIRRRGPAGRLRRRQRPRAGLPVPRRRPRDLRHDTAGSVGVVRAPAPRTLLLRAAQSVRADLVPRPGRGHRRGHLRGCTSDRTVHRGARPQAPVRQSGTTAPSRSWSDSCWDRSASCGRFTDYTPEGREVLAWPVTGGGETVGGGWLAFAVGAVVVLLLDRVGRRVKGS